MSMYPTCCLCGKEMFDTDMHLINKQVVGFERPRKKGLNALRMKRETGAVAHDSCVEQAAAKAKRGIPIQQGGLF